MRSLRSDWAAGRRGGKRAGRSDGADARRPITGKCDRAWPSRDCQTKPRSPPPSHSPSRRRVAPATRRAPAPRRIASNFAALSLAEIVCRGTSVAVTLSLAKSLGAAGYGRIEFAFNVVFWLVLIVRDAFEGIVVRELARHPRLIRPLVNHVLAVKGLLAVGLFAGLVRSGALTLSAADRPDGPGALRPAAVHDGAGARLRLSRAPSGWAWWPSRSASGRWSMRRGSGRASPTPRGSPGCRRGWRWARRAGSRLVWGCYVAPVRPAAAGAGRCGSSGSSCGAAGRSA